MPLLDFNSLGRRYHAARAAAAILAMVFFGALWLFWDWSSGLGIVGVAIPVLIHAVWRRNRPGHAFWVLALDVTAVTLALTVIAPPITVAVPPLVTLIIAGMLFLDQRRAILLFGYMILGVGSSLAWIQMTETPEWTLTESIVLSVINLAVWVPLMVSLLRATARMLDERRSLQVKLVESEARYRLIIESASDAIVAVDGSGIVVFANQAVSRTFGHDPGDLVGQPLTILIPEHLRAAHTEGFRRYRESGNRRLDWNSLQLTGLHSDGSEIALEVSFGEFAHKSADLFIGTMRDVGERKVAEKALQASEARYRELFESVPVGIYRTTHSGEIRTANPAMASLLGVDSPEELVGLDAQQFYLEAGGRERWKEQLDVSSADSEFELRLVRADGETIWVRDTGRALLDEEGNLIEFEGTLEDVTQRKHAQERLESLVGEQQRRLRFERALSACSTALLTESGEQALDDALGALMDATDADSVFVERNVHDEDLGLCSSLIHQIDRFEGAVDYEKWQRVPWSKMPRALRRLSRGEPFAFVIEELDGEERRLYEGAAIQSELDFPIFVGDEWAGLIAFGDDWQRVWAQDEIDLLRTAAEMVGAFWARQQAQEKLEDLIRSKDEFVASVSHELRTPLTAVVGLAEELTGNGLAQFDETEIVEFHHVIAQQAREVSYIVEDLLVAARVDIGAVSVYPGPVDLRDEVTLVINGWSTQFGDVAVKNGSAKALADPTRVRQIVRNLLANAVRYGGSRVVVEAVQEDDRSVVAVRDNGAGIAEEHWEKIFSAYERLSQSQPKPGSVGLGLYVSRRLARLMDGDLTYRREDDESIFELILPTV